MSAFTAGPWDYSEDRRGRKRVFAGDYEVVRALSKHGSRKLSVAEREANARLIASAPDLLAALKATLVYLNPTLKPAPESLHKAVDAAIAKAEGHQ